MAAFGGKWTKFSQKGTGPGARSSHAITVVGDKAYAFGGEFAPRVPVDNNLHIFDLETSTWSISAATGDVPAPRVGVTMASVGTTLYVFGGRDADHQELDEFYAFDTLTNTWTRIPGDGPPNRSYHSMAADERRVYVFGGCGVSGRLNDLWAYDTVARAWDGCPAPGEACRGRGGTGLVVVEGKVWVVYGFAGEEVDDVHAYDVEKRTWERVGTGGERPSARSVFCAARVGRRVVVFGGEVDPSEEGHLGAGRFSGEAYVLDTETRMWARAVEGEKGEHHPGARGWCAHAGAVRDGKEGLIVYGGNSPSNDRLDDFYFFEPRL
ncbi:Nitrile-specifier protein 2 [Acorus gramineus]|uniref:Nitrile-specifier protein 2 n=1 Tax=Acorus gramineus TaxID=55184 RepID=A0AAV9AX40_ACOGR|nr:Nitrile-specifier protein 2 [Acorus gramineus]